MNPIEHEALRALLAQIRPIYDELAGRRAGVGVLHLEATIAALESHLRRNRASVLDELRPEPVRTMH